MPDQTDEAIERLSEDVSRKLQAMFDGLAKTVFQAASESADPKLNPIDKLRNAHAKVTLIVEDAMRGLADAHESVFQKGLALGIDMGIAISATED